ncbi:MAG: hypothetical protein AAGH64_02985 [Planctomycetota bacterium]
MPNIACAQCAASIPTADVNIAEGVALCRSCNSITSLADMVEAQEDLPTADPDVVPEGCRVDSDGISKTFVVKVRSVVGGVFLLLFSTAWCSITSLFVGLGVAGVLAHLGMQPPSWVPGMGSGGGSQIPLVMSIAILLFMLPFIAIGIFTFVMALTSFFGVLRVRIEGTRGTAFTGVGPIGLRKKFDTSRITDIRIEEKLSDYRDSEGRSRTRHTRFVEINAGKRLRLASMASEERQDWLAAALHRHVSGRR